MTVFQRNIFIIAITRFAALTINIVIFHYHYQRTYCRNYFHCCYGVHVNVRRVLVRRIKNRFNLMCAKTRIVSVDETERFQYASH